MNDKEKDLSAQIEHISRFSSPNGTTFELDRRGGKSISSPGTIKEIISKFSPKELLDAAQNMLRVPRETLEQVPLERVFREVETSAAGYTCGITARSAEHSNKILPRILEILAQPNLKIAIVGNGLSELPLSVNTKSQVTIIDLINYPKISEDLDALNDSLQSQGLSNNFNHEKENAQKILSAPNINTVQYLFGTSRLPSELVGKFDIVIDIYGPVPTQKNLAELLSLLKKSGTFWSSEDIELVGNSLSASNLGSQFEASSIASSEPGGATAVVRK